jgi:hydroxymethylpyrimidine pyrophosphatase-like HAD family hydrolase
MHFHVLATDYDGTLAERGLVDDPVWSAIRRLRETGRKAVMVTGRELEDLQSICPHLDLFDRVVAENGALIYDPKSKEVRLLAESPPPAFTASLAGLGVTPLSVGHVIVATVKPFETDVLTAISDLGLEMQVIFNQDSVMALPTGVNKATGLVVALKEIGYSPHNTVGIGDAENDHALLSVCEVGVAVGNAVPALRARADWVTRGHAGSSVVELIDEIVRDDLQSVSAKVTRHSILVGRSADGTELTVRPQGANVLIAGSSGSGKSVIAAGLLDRFREAYYQFVVIDPEGDYSELPDAAVLGSSERAPLMEEVRSLLSAGRNVVINLLGIPLADRPNFFHELLPEISELRRRRGRPHLILVDEAHHLMPMSWSPPAANSLDHVTGLAMVTVHPASISRPVLAGVDLFLAMGREIMKTVSDFLRMRGETPPEVKSEVADGEALALWVGADRPPLVVKPVPSRTEQRRHRRKYAEGRLPEDRNFVFRGPKGKLQLRAYNLITFLELADGVDDATFLHHLRGHEYSRWFRDAIKDDELARDAEDIEARLARDPAGAREQFRKAIEQRYTLPADAPSGTQ